MIRSWSEKPTARRAEVGKAVLGLAYSRLPNQTPAFSPHFNPQCCICLETSSKSYAEILGLDHMLRSSVQIVCWDPQLRSYAENLCLDRMLRSSFLNQMLRPESISIWSELTISRANLFHFHFHVYIYILKTFKLSSDLRRWPRVRCIVISGEIF